MSSDLWAAFGSPKVSDTSSNRPKSSAQQPVHDAWTTASRTGTEDRTKGEDGSDHSDADSWTAVNNELENAWQDTNQSESVPSQVRPGIVTIGPASNSGVLVVDEDDFGDFENAENDSSGIGTHLERTQLAEPVPKSILQSDEPDDFGDFEDAEPSSNVQSRDSQTHHLGSIDALQQFIDSQPDPNFDQGLAPESPSLLDLRSPTTSSQMQANASLARDHTQGKKVAFKEQPVLYAESDSDDSGNWADLGGPQSMAKAPARRKAAKQQEKEPQPTSKAAPTNSRPPPTNLPPPSVLMALVASLLSDLPERIRVTIVETWEEDEADVKKYVGLFQVTARILAGRKLRWKRDTHLAQNMSIGMAGRPGGMKLAGVDRAELQREEREASELVRSWRQNLGTIRSALAESGNGTSTKPLALPLIAESIPVRTLKPEDGGVKSPRCCVICGLKRDERAEKVDIDIWDQFGEWWTEHWGHNTCRAFWEEYESHLRRV